jgi:hypothetical protein
MSEMKKCKQRKHFKTICFNRNGFYKQQWLVATFVAHIFSLLLFYQFFRNISDNRFRLRMTSQAVGMGFIIKVCVSKISHCESS